MLNLLAELNRVVEGYADAPTYAAAGSKMSKMTAQLHMQQVSSFYYYTRIRIYYFIRICDSTTIKKYYDTTILRYYDISVLLSY